MCLLPGLYSQYIYIYIFTLRLGGYYTINSLFGGRASPDMQVTFWSLDGISSLPERNCLVPKIHLNPGKKY